MGTELLPATSVACTFCSCLLFLEPSSPGSLVALLPTWLGSGGVLGDWALGEPWLETLTRCVEVGADAAAVDRPAGWADAEA